MKKSLLITIRDASSCSQGVRFVSSFFGGQQNIELTLFYLMGQSVVEQGISEMWDDVRGDNLALPARIEKAFALCGNALRQKGFVDGQIRKVTRKARWGTVRDIVEEGEKGLYDAVVLGKRSTSFVEDLISGNKGHEILKKELAGPVWFCRDPEEGRRHVLLCLDGSGRGARIADHVGFMLQGEEGHTITLFHVDKGQGLDRQRMFEEARQVLSSYGIGPDRLEQKVKKSLRGAAAAILNEADQGRYAAIAMGSVGRTIKRGMYEALVGSKCRQVFNDLDKAALWIVP